MVVLFIRHFIVSMKHKKKTLFSPVNIMNVCLLSINNDKKNSNSLKMQVNLVHGNIVLKTQQKQLN